MHEEGIAHRDIKGENILLSHDLSIKFCDFGSCIDCNRKFKKKSEFLFNEEEMQEPIGSLGFNAPEVNNKEYEFYDYQKADIFSIGCLLFQAVKKVLIFFLRLWENFRSNLARERIRFTEG